MLTILTGWMQRRFDRSQTGAHRVERSLNRSRAYGRNILTGVFREIGEVYVDVYRPEDACLNLALDVLRYCKAVLHLVGAHELDFFQEDRRALHEAARLPKGHVGLGVDPQLAFKETHLFAPWRDLQNVCLLAVVVL